MITKFHPCIYSLADERTNEVLELYNKMHMNYGEMYIIEESEQRKTCDFINRIMSLYTSVL